MSVIYILIPIAILLTAIGIYIFFWAVKTDQFDDLEKQGMSILFDEKPSKSDQPENIALKTPEDVANKPTKNATIESTDFKK